MAFDYVHHTNAFGNPITDLTLTKPTGTTTDDILFALLKDASGGDPSSVPSGWTLAGSDVLTSSVKHFLYYKVAGGSEPANYTWTWASGTRLTGTMICYRGGFNTADPIDVSSNTSYETSNTTCRAASMTVASIGSPIIFFGLVNDTLDGTVSFGVPNNPSGATWTERVDLHENRTARTISDTIWSSSGATSDMDSTINSTETEKHAFAVALKPEAGGGGGGGGTTITGLGRRMVGWVYQQGSL